MNATWNVVPILALLTLGPLGASAAPQTTGEQPKNHVVQAKDAVVKGAKVVGEKTKDGLSKTGEVMTDAWITARVSSRFVNEDLLKGSDINVGTAQHVVTLKGTVTSSAGRTHAGVVAKGTEGVSRVVNRLIVAPKHS